MGVYRGGNLMEQIEEHDAKHSTQAVPKEKEQTEKPVEEHSANTPNTLPPETMETRKPETAEPAAHYTAQKLLQEPFTPWLHAGAPVTSLHGKRRLCARLQKLPWLLAGLGLGAVCFVLSYSLASHFLFPDPLSLASSALSSNGGNSPPFEALRQLLYGILSRGNILFQLLLFAFVAGVVTLLSFLCSWLAQKFQKQLHRATETDAQKLHTLPLLDRTDNLEPQSESQTKEVPEPQQEELEEASREIWQEPPGTSTNESEPHNNCDDCEPIQEQPIRNEAIQERTEQPAQKEAAAQSGQETSNLFRC